MMMMADQYRGRNLEQRVIKDADQTEFDAMLKDSVLVSAGLFDDRVSGAMDDFEFSDSSVVHESWHAQDLQNDTAGGLLHEELLRRQDLLTSAYPFEIKGSQILYRPSESQFYEFCLAISCAQSLTEGKYVDLPRIFERMSAILVKKFLGYDSLSLHVGTPRDEDVGKKFSAAMKKASELSQEWVWSPMQPYPNDPDTTGDEGLDFITWKDSPDKRPGKLFVIGQCACGDDWKEKFKDLSLDKIGKWFNPIAYVTPVRAFATPHHLSDMNLINAQLEAGLVFDRARLSLIAEKFAIEQDIADWKEKIVSLKQMVIQ